MRFYEDRLQAVKEQLATDSLVTRIKHGETATLEFKSSLRYNIRANKIDKDIENSVLKTIAAFCNTKGGELLIGVADDKSIVGIEHEGFAKRRQVPTPPVATSSWIGSSRQSQNSLSSAWPRSRERAFAMSPASRANGRIFGLSPTRTARTLLCEDRPLINGTATTTSIRLHQRALRTKISPGLARAGWR